jgi:thiol-disulfide isomerase/thioredoxin
MKIGAVVLEVVFMKFLVTLLVAFVIAAPAWSMQDQGGAPAANETKALPPLKLQDFDGKAIPSDQFKGNIVVLDFWATWCVPCIAEIPTLNRLQEKYGAQGVTVLGVTMASGEAAEVKPFIGRNKMKYKVLMGDDDQVYDLNVVAFPTTYLVTRDMKIFRRYIGAGPKKAADLEADIQKLLAVN